MKLKNQNQSLLNLILILSLIFLLDRPIIAVIGPNGEETPEDQLQYILPEEAAGQSKTELMIPYNPNPQSTIRGRDPASFHRRPVDSLNPQSSFPTNTMSSEQAADSGIIPQPLSDEQDEFNEFEDPLSQSENYDQSLTQEQENIDLQPFVRLPPLRPSGEIIETVLPNSVRSDESLFQKGETEPTKTSVDQEEPNAIQEDYQWDSAQKHFQPNLRDGLTQQDSSDLYYDVEKDKTPVPQTQLGHPVEEFDQNSPPDVERSLTTYDPKIPVIEGNFVPDPIPVEFQNPEQSSVKENSSSQNLPTSFIPNPETEKIEQEARFDDPTIPPQSSTSQFQEATQLQQPTHKLVSEKISDQATLDPSQETIPAPMIQAQEEATKTKQPEEDAATKTLKAPSIKQKTQRAKPTAKTKSKQKTSKTVSLPAAKTNENTNTITINVGQTSPQNGQIPNFGGMPGFFYSPFFNPLQFMPSGYPAITWPYSSAPGAANQQQGQGGQMAQFPGQAQGLPQQIGSPQNSQAMPGQSTSAPISQPVALSSTPVLSGSSMPSSSSLSAQRTDLVAAIKALRTKLEQTSLSSLLGSDLKNFNSRLDEFQTIVDLILARGYELFITTLLAETETVKTEMTELSALITVMVESGRSSSDQDQVRPFSLKSYDKDSVTVLNRFSDILGSLIEAEAFALTMQHLGLLDKFLASCKIIMFPPFTPFYSIDPLDGDRQFRASYDKFVGKLNAMATSLNSSDIREKQSIPEPLLTMLEEMDYSPDLMAIQPFGFKENTTLNLYTKYTKDNFPKDQPSRNKISAALSKDIFRDILATALVRLILIGAEIFVDKFEASTFFKSIPEALRLMFVASIENLYAVKVASIVETSASGPTKKRIRHTVLDKLDEELEGLISTKQTSTGFRKLAVNSGTSFRDFQILQLLAKAEALLRISGPGEVAYEATTAAARILKDYKDGTAILCKIFLTYTDMTFSIIDPSGIAIKQISDSTINRLFAALEDANEDSRTITGTAKAQYTAARTQLMDCVKRNSPFTARLAQTNQAAKTKLNSFISRP